VFELQEADALELYVQFERARLGEGVAQRLLDAVEFCLEQLAGDGALTVADVDVVPPAERHKLLASWNDTARPFDAAATLHQLFERQVRARPSDVAVQVNGRGYTYRELDQRANRIAHALRARGVRPGTHVGVCLGRSQDLVAALLAVSKSGAAYVPLDSHYPAERLRHMVADSGPVLVVTESRFESRFDRVSLVLDEPELAREIAALPSHAPEARSRSSDACYVIYTSGSTGTPKGAVLTHRAVINTLEWVNRTFEIGPGDRALFVTSPSFDLSVYDVFGVLGAGATLVVADEQLIGEPEALARTLIDQGITLWNSAPSFLQLVLPFIATARRPNEAEATAPSLRLVLLSGDWIPLNLVHQARAAFPRARVISLGGATEAAIWSNWFSVDAVEPHWVSIPYGKPIQNCQYYALDERMRLVPVGTVGELYIGGECVAKGYLNRAELTAERFLPDPFSGRPNARLYRTGDLVRFFEDGNIELLGRADGQVKIRGFRLELAEVDAALIALPEVAQAVCSPQVDGSGQKALVAYVVPREGQSVTEEAVKDALSRTLPDFMVPSRVVVLGGLPLTANGKVDRAALSQLKEQRDGAGLSPLMTETERGVAAIWERVLQRSPIGGNDNFFALGGHSLLAVQAFHAIERELGVGVQVSALFEYPTLSALAAHVDQLRSATGPADWTSVVPIQPHGSRPPLFMVAGAGGNPLGQRNLVPVLGPEQPLFALRHRGTDGRLAPHTDVREMARDMLSDIRKVQPHGPYYLSGFSGGGVVAYEMAQMLSDQGERVNLLALLDTYNPNVAKKPLSARLARLFRLSRRYGNGYLLRRLLARAQDAARRLRRQLATPRRRLDPVESRDESMFASFRAALSRYTPQPYSGNTLLVRCKIEISPSAEGDSLETNGWASLITGKLEVVTIDCPHDDLLGSHALPAARSIDWALRSASLGHGLR
jgi:amino acid adenylation domain-containing protein